MLKNVGVTLYGVFDKNEHTSGIPYPMSITVLGQWDLHMVNPWCMTSGVYIGTSYEHTTQGRHGVIVIIDVENDAEYYSDYETMNAVCRAWCDRSPYMSYGEHTYGIGIDPVLCYRVIDDMNERAINPDCLVQLTDNTYLVEVAHDFQMTRCEITFCV